MYVLVRRRFSRNQLTSAAIPPFRKFLWRGGRVTAIFSIGKRPDPSANTLSRVSVSSPAPAK